jgi:hypothetical protein
MGDGSTRFSITGLGRTPARAQARARGKTFLKS